MGNDKKMLSDEELNNIAGGADGNSNSFVEINGTILEVLPYCGFKVQLDNGEAIVAYTSGALRTHFARIHVGDRVTVKRYSDGSNARVTAVLKG